MATDQTEHGLVSKVDPLPSDPTILRRDPGDRPAAPPRATFLTGKGPLRGGQPGGGPGEETPIPVLPPSEVVASKATPRSTPTTPPVVTDQALRGRPYFVYHPTRQPRLYTSGTHRHPPHHESIIPTSHIHQRFRHGPFPIPLTPEGVSPLGSL
jgi:hypothetical protein